MIIENLDLTKHDLKQVSKLIYDSDIEFNELVLGGREEAIHIIQQMMKMEKTYYSSPYVKCAMLNDKIVGVVVGYSILEKKEVDSISGKAFFKLFGFFKFMKKMGLFIKMGKITSGEMAPDGYYIVHLCVEELEQGKGIGRSIINELYKTYSKIYLHVNINKDDAIKFYETVGFTKGHKAIITIKKKQLGTIFMKKINP